MFQRGIAVVGGGVVEWRLGFDKARCRLKEVCWSSFVWIT